MTGTRLGAIALSAAAVCDLTAWTVLAVVQALVEGNGRDYWRVALVIPYALFLYACVRPLLRRILTRKGADRSLTGNSRVMLLSGLFVSSSVTQLLGLHFVLGAFFFGLVVPGVGSGAYRQEVMRDTQFATNLLLPVYFIVAGLNVNLSGVGFQGLGELGLIVLVAVAGKFGGAWLAARSQGLPPRDSAVLATLMNTRGLTELIALSIGLQAGILDGQLYSLMVVMAEVTTVATGPLLMWLAPGRQTGTALTRPDGTDGEAPPPAGAVGTRDIKSASGPAARGQPTRTAHPADCSAAPPEALNTQGEGSEG
ncbi:cation:proton antiporter [Streptomyces antimycoticus]